LGDQPEVGVVGPVGELARGGHQRCPLGGHCIGVITRLRLHARPPMSRRVRVG
jgi:hypothetical protein